MASYVKYNSSLSLLIILEEADDIQTQRADLVVFLVALLRDFVAQVAHPPHRHAEEVGVLLALIVVAQLQQLVEQEESDRTQVVVLFAEMLVAGLQQVFAGQ